MSFRYYQRNRSVLFWECIVKIYLSLNVICITKQSLQRYLFLVLKEADESFDRIGQYDRGNKPIRCKKTSKIFFSKGHLL